MGGVRVETLQSDVLFSVTKWKFELGFHISVESRQGDITKYKMNRSKAGLFSALAVVCIVGIIARYQLVSLSDLSWGNFRNLLSASSRNTSKVLQSEREEQLEEGDSSSALTNTTNLVTDAASKNSVYELKTALETGRYGTTRVFPLRLKLS